MSFVIADVAVRSRIETRDPLQQIGKLGECDGTWCQLDVAGHKGWVEQKRLWGAGDP